MIVESNSPYPQPEICKCGKWFIPKYVRAWHEALRQYINILTAVCEECWNEDY